MPFDREIIKRPSEDNDDEDTDREWELRDALPADRDPNSKPSIWKVLKDLIGKDLSRFAIPVYFNEPISMMQKVAEIMEYTDLLNKADQTDDPLMRMLYVIAFSISQYKGPDNRLYKPFNPILGETFELLTPDYKYFAE